MSNLVKETRKKLGLSIREVAKMSGLSFQSVWNLEEKKVSDDKIRFSTVKKLSVALNKKIEELFF